MIQPQNMEPVKQIIERAKKITESHDYRSDTDKLHHVLGHLEVTITYLQDHIRKVERAIKEEHRWAKDTKVSDESVEFMKGYVHACDILATTAGVKL